MNRGRSVPPDAEVELEPDHIEHQHHATHEGAQTRGWYLLRDKQEGSPRPINLTDGKEKENSGEDRHRAQRDSVLSLSDISRLRSRQCGLVISRPAGAFA